MTPLKAIRLKCPDCPLFPFRFGKNPNRAGLTNGGSFSKNNGTASDYSPETAEEG